MATLSPADSQNGPSGTKRKASTAGLPGPTNRPAKRRASKACQCCRARKVRCNVVENGAPCTNCRLDEVECIVTESKRRKKSRDLDLNRAKDSSAEVSEDNAYRHDEENSQLSGFSIPETYHPLSPSHRSLDFENDQHVPHMICQSHQSQSLSHFGLDLGLQHPDQTQGHRLSADERNRRMSMSRPPLPNFTQSQMATMRRLFSPSFALHARPAAALPGFIKPLPARIGADDVEYLEKKGALTVPPIALRNALLQSYVEYVHGYMPLLDLNDFLSAVQRSDGMTGHISLLLFQAVMFAGAAFVDFEHLRAAGFQTRKAARKAFFQKARLLYDFDYELDRISLIQALLLMTYWYETPDDQKDTWHWMGVAIGLSHTIGLHRNPEKSNMDAKRQALWKRVWWCCFMRDRLIALGMRRPTRIKNEDCDVPMLDLNDFQFYDLPDKILRLVGNSPIARSAQKQRELATMCVEKAKLCVCISHVLSAQYSVLCHKIGGSTETTMMLVPKKSAAETCDVRRCDQELDSWFVNLPEIVHYETPDTTLTNGDDVILLHRALLNMIYLTTSSALHRPQVLPSTPSPTPDTDLLSLSRSKVRDAAVEITNIAHDLQNHNLVRCLPTSGVTVLLPAVIIHLLDIKSTVEEVRATSLRRFCICMQILQRMREMYASADFATSFLEAAIRKANIQVTPTGARAAASSKPDFPVLDLPRFNTLTPPPEQLTPSLHIPSDPADPYLFTTTATPPPSDESESSSSPLYNHHNHTHNSSHSHQNNTLPDQGFLAPASLNDLMCFGSNPNSPSFLALDKTIDFDSLIDFDADDLFAQGEGEKAGISLELGLHGESGGFTLDGLDWAADGFGSGVPGLDSVVGDMASVCKPMDTVVGGIDVDGMMMMV